MKAARGLYFKGSKTRYGMARPNNLDIALEVLGKAGTGRCGFSAARNLGLSIQVPAEVELAISRTELSYLDIAQLEVLREPGLIESGRSALVHADRRSVKEDRVHTSWRAASFVHSATHSHRARLGLHSA